MDVRLEGTDSLEKKERMTTFVNSSGKRGRKKDVKMKKWTYVFLYYFSIAATL